MPSRDGAVPTKNSVRVGWVSDSVRSAWPRGGFPNPGRAIPAISWTPWFGVDTPWSTPLSGEWRHAVGDANEHRSGRATFVMMMQATNVWDLDDRPAGPRVCGPRLTSLACPDEAHPRVGQAEGERSLEAAGVEIYRARPANWLMAWRFWS